MSAQSFDALAIIDALSRHEVDYVVVGGWAALQHGASRPTDDLDICPRWTIENLDRVAAALSELGAEILVESGHTVPVPIIDGVLISRMAIGNWNTRAGGLDILMEIPHTSREDTVGFDELITHADPIEARGRRVWLAALDAVIRSKQVADRAKDREALPELRRLQKLAGTDLDAQ